MYKKRCNRLSKEKKRNNQLGAGKKKEGSANAPLLLTQNYCFIAAIAAALAFKTSLVTSFPAS